MTNLRKSAVCWMERRPCGGVDAGTEPTGVRRTAPYGLQESRPGTCERSRSAVRKYLRRVAVHTTDRGLSRGFPVGHNTRKILVTILLLILPLSGVWQLGLGAYIHAKAVLAQILLEAAWVVTLNGHMEVKPWPWADTWPVSRLTVPRLGIRRIVLAGASGSSLAFGPGLFSGAPLPGSTGNAIIAGHRDTHFRFLKELKPGDVMILQTPDAFSYHYRITEVKVINETDTQYLADTGDKTLTLITCFPFDAIVPGGPLRYLVIAKTPDAVPALLL